METRSRPLAELLDPAAVSSAEALGMHAREIVEGYIAGEHKSRYHGFAIEFAQHREYSSGDDIRHLDWKVLGRTDRYYIKQYEQETNYVGHLLLDGSESMKYGSGSHSKLAYGKMLAACLSYTILKQRDAVSLNIFDTVSRQHLQRSNRGPLPHPSPRKIHTSISHLCMSHSHPTSPNLTVVVAVGGCSHTPPRPSPPAHRQG